MMALKGLFTIFLDLFSPIVMGCGGLVYMRLVIEKIGDADDGNHISSNY